ncbi:hypothetical protein ANO14919_002250 [Xylariales sp. No.14919]|nr:hypothetical protein ANO14919_002250 [Xylariales sp. No.14919]
MMSLQENPDLDKILKKLKDLSKQAYYLPDFWVCEVCAELHPVDNDDTPTFYDAGAGAHTPIIPDVELTVASTKSTIVTSIKPRIIEDYGGTRFLTKSSWDFIRKPSDDSEWNTIRELRICPHLYRVGRGNDVINKTPLNIAVGKALAAKGQEYTNSCTSCPTDYLIRMVDCGAEVRAWQDFGTEGSPASQLWRSHCTWSLESTTEKQRPSQPAARAPGYIRNIYDFGPSPAFLQQLLPP